MASSLSLTPWKPLSRLDLTVIEHRKSQRFELRLPIEVVRSADRLASAYGYTINLSSSGVLFEMDRPIEVGEIVEYYITLPKTANMESEVQLRCMGKVLRSYERFVAATMERYEFIRNRAALSPEPSLVREAAAG
jgi:hypothetical protein